MNVGVISDQYGPGNLLLGGDAQFSAWVPTSGLPTASQLSAMDILILVGPLVDAGVATQLSGVVKLAIERSKATFVFAYSQQISDADRTFIHNFGIPRLTNALESSVSAYPEAFHEYFTQYGRTNYVFHSGEIGGANVIGWTGSGSAVALCIETGIDSVIYSVPYFVSKSGDPSHMLLTLLAAITDHEDTLAAGVPSYLSDVRLCAGEVAALGKIDELEKALAAKRDEAVAFERWRHLIGRTSGTHLVQLVVEALNTVLDTTQFHAETRADVGAEDFWIVGPKNRDFALGEAKGIGGGIARSNVGQVDSHREARKLPPDFPGLLVVNAFRSDADLTRKQGAEVARNVIDLANTQNVVVMRTWDLYQLVGRYLDGPAVAEGLTSALSDKEGGWLFLDESNISFRH